MVLSMGLASIINKMKYTIYRGSKKGHYMSISLNFFQSGPIPADAISGTYNFGLVALSYFIAVLASYVALDLTGRLRAEKTRKLKLFWLLGGAFAMGAGIWSMHFIGMLAFIMPMPMRYDLSSTISSMLVAILASAFALFLLQKEKRQFLSLALGGIFLGLGIVTMHYMGMEAMTGHVNIRYLPGLFILSILIAIIASEVALWLMLQSNRGTYRRQLPLKFISALVMGAAICGMHYTGMAAAVFTPLGHSDNTVYMGKVLGPYMLAFYIAGITGLIICIALIVSTYKQLLGSAVQNEKNFLNAMLDNLEDGIIACDAKGKITLINRTLQKKINITEKIQYPTDLSAYLRPLDSKKKIDRKNNPLIRALQGEKIHAVEFLMVFQNGSTRNVIVDGQPIINVNGNKLGAVIVIHDITERKRIEKYKSEFVSMVSHELRTPLTSIRGSLGLIVGGATGELNEKTKNLLHIAHNNCERLIRLINDILDTEKIEAGKMDFTLQVFPIAELVNDAITTNEAYGKKFDVKIQLAGQTSDIKVKVDRDRVIQVITNLISNAVKFSPKGEAVILDMTVVDDIWVKVSITDKGKGIPENFQNRVFQKFAQADSSSARMQGGTGLGLSISKTIIEKLGGKLAFITEQNKGTTFYFNLPIWHEKITAMAQKKSAASHILICEDDKDIASLLRIILEENGFYVDVAYTIEHARDLLTTRHYDAMTLDLVLPDGDGIALMKELRNDLKHEKMPVIVISGKADMNRKLLNGDAINIIDWLNKPVNPEQLTNAIKHVKMTLLNDKPYILHVEDDQDLLTIIAAILENEATLKAACTLHEAQQLLAQEKFDLVLLDLALPDGSGVELLPSLAKLNIPVIVFSAHELPKDYIQYVTTILTKSRTTDNELLAAIKAAINRRDNANA